MLSLNALGHEIDKVPETETRLNVVLYARDSKALICIQKLISEFSPKARIELYRSVEAFSERLHQPSYGSPVAVIAVTDKADLQDISSLQELLWPLRIILLLPDGDDETVAMGHSIRPRFVSYCNDGLKDVAAILNKMIEDHDSKLRVRRF